jgi:hypothetical protein
MRRIIAAFACAAALALGLTVGLPSAAHADGDCEYEYFCVYADETETYLWSSGDMDAWSSLLANKADWVMNNGNPNYAEHLVDIFFKTKDEGFGAYACMDTGTAWDLRGNGYIFSWHGWHGTDGLEQNVHDNAAAHHWVSGACENYNDDGF